MERNIMSNMTTKLSYGVEDDLGKPWLGIGAIL
jgi:hypothetical protein